MTWTCIGWMDAQPLLGSAFARQGLALNAISTAEFLEGKTPAKVDKLIFAGSFMRFPTDAQEAMCEAYIRRARELLQKAECPQLIFISSAAVYGLSSLKEPRREDEALDPQSTYAHEKVKLEAALSDATLASGGRCLVLRPSGMFGKTGLMNRANNLVDKILAAIRSEEALELQIDNGGAQVRDFIHVSDFVDIISQAAARLDRLIPQSGTLVLNATNGEALVIGELVEAARQRAATIQVSYSTPTTDAMHCLLDTEQLANYFDIAGFRRVMDVINQEASK